MTKERIQPVIRDNFDESKCAKKEDYHVLESFPEGVMIPREWPVLEKCRDQEIIDLLKAVVIRLDAIKSNTCKGF